MSEPRKPLSEKELRELSERHDELVLCRRCKEWTSYGESCCGETQCDDDQCPRCIEEGYV